MRRGRLGPACCKPPFYLASTTPTEPPHLLTPPCAQVGFCSTLLPPLRRSARRAAAAMDRKPISDLVA